MENLKVIFNNGQFHVVGGGLCDGTSWGAYDTEYEARAIGAAIAEDLGVIFLSIKGSPLPGA